jgi:hypothetical protein
MKEQPPIPNQAPPWNDTDDVEKHDFLCRTVRDESRRSNLAVARFNDERIAIAAELAGLGLKPPYVSDEKLQGLQKRVVKCGDELTKSEKLEKLENAPPPPPAPQSVADRLAADVELYK